MWHTQTETEQQGQSNPTAEHHDCRVQVAVREERPARGAEPVEISRNTVSELEVADGIATGPGPFPVAGRNAFTTATIAPILVGRERKATAGKVRLAEWSDKRAADTEQLAQQ